MITARRRCAVAFVTTTLLLTPFLPAGRIAPALGAPNPPVEFDETPPPTEQSGSTSGSSSGSHLDVGYEKARSDILSEARGGNAGSTPSAPKSPPPPPQYRYVWAPVSRFTGCGAGTGSWNCSPHPDSCEAGDGTTVQGRGDALDRRATRGPQRGSEGITQRGTRIDNDTGERTDLGIRCLRPGQTPDEAAAVEAAPPVVITVTLSDFERMPVKPLRASAGPADGWLPVNMPNVMHTDPQVQELDVELLSTPVTIRATPVSYHWDLGDGNTITTTDAGEPYPSEAVSGRYTHEGWYDVTLTTTFTGQFSVDGGEWQDIEGTIDVASDPIPLYAKSLESRLVDGDVPVDEDEDPWIPARTPETEGPQDPDATHRTL